MSGEEYAMKNLSFTMGSKEPHDVPITEKSMDRDEADLARFGKKQQLRRNFGLLSIISLTCTLMITWEGWLTVFSGGLFNGGPTALVYGFIIVWIGNILQVLVMCEMASMMPLAGGQYNWVAILSPPWCTKFLSYLTGWITVISWQAVIASAAFIGGTMIQGLLILAHPTDYEPQRWHGTLLFYALIALSLFVNTVLAKYLPHIESMVFIIHIIGFFCILIPLVHFAPHGTAKDVFGTFVNEGGWPTDGLAFFVGLVPSMFSFIGLDAAGHMAEEIQNAASVIPKSMLASVFINGSLGFAMVIAILFCLGDLESVLGTATGFPYIQIFFNATNSVGGAIAMSSIIVAANTFATIGVLATGSRMMWAFARERGLPGSGLIARVEPRTALPLYSIGISVLISVLLALINIGSTAAFNAFTSLVIAAFYSSYMLAAIMLLNKRLQTPLSEMAFGPFHLGKWGVPVIIASLIYSTIGIFFSFWPTTTNPTPETMNWSIAIFGGSLLFAMVFWFVHGRKVYTGPIMELNVRHTD